MAAGYTKQEIKNMILAAQAEYRTKLAGKAFLYVYGDKHFEVIFKTASFLHLTGVESDLSAQQFYRYAGKGILRPNQFYYTDRHPRRTAISKLKLLNNLSVITREQVCMVQDLKTLTFTYRIGLTNLDFTLCLTEDTDKNGNILSDYFVPRSFRVKDRSIENSSQSEFIDFIFEKSAADTLYSKLNFKNPAKPLPNSLSEKISGDFYLTCTV